MDSTAIIAGSRDQSGGAWINGARWDIGWLIGSAAIVPLVLIFVWMGTGSAWINMGITAIIGGPHLFSTYTASYFDPTFRRRHLGLLVAASIAVPAFVIYWTLVDFQILLSVFILAASLHVLQQNAYITGIYSKKLGRPESPWSRIIDYGLLMLCIYPIASYKLVHSNFMLGDVQILIPPFLMVPATYWLVWIAFGLFLAMWLIKTWREVKSQTLNRPKTLLIGVTTVIAFLVPMAASGERLELAFQSVNAWHSIQYLGIVWYIQKIRKERNEIRSPMIAKMSGGGRAAWRFYGFCCLLTLGLFGVLMALWQLDPFGLQFQQYYYMCVLSCLLIHYVLDGYFFTVSNRPQAASQGIPYAAPAAS